MCSRAFVYYKELAHAVMEADRSQDLQSASWRPKRANGVVFWSESEGLRTRNANGGKFLSRDGRFETQEESMFQFQS